MTWQIDHLAFQIADGELFAIGKKMIKLRTVYRKLRFQIENLLEDSLNNSDVLPDSNFAAQNLLQIGCRCQMVRVRMRLQNPFDG